MHDVQRHYLPRAQLRDPPTANAAAIELAAYAERQTRTPILEVVEHSG